MRMSEDWALLLRTVSEPETGEESMRRNGDYIVVTNGQSANRQA